MMKKLTTLILFLAIAVAGLSQTYTITKENNVVKIADATEFKTYPLNTLSAETDGNNVIIRVNPSFKLALRAAYTDISPVTASAKALVDSLNFSIFVSDTVTATISESNPGTISTVNSSTATLAPSTAFTGTSEDVSQYSTITVFVDTDQDGTLSMQFSSDGTNWDRAKNVPVDQELASGSVHTLEVVSQYFRIVYTNGTVEQNHFRLQTIYHQNKSGFLTSSPDQVISKINDAQIVRVANDVLIDLSRGLYGDKQTVHKFGQNESSPSGTERDIWAYGATTLGNANYTFPDTIDRFEIVSSSPNDTSADSYSGAWSLILVYLDTNWEEKFDTVNLLGTTSVITSSTGFRLNRAFVHNVGTYGGTNEGNITITHWTTGDVLGYIRAGAGQTEQTMYTVPADHTAYIRHAHAAVSAGANKDATVTLYRRSAADSVDLGFKAKRLSHTWPNLQGVAELDFYAMPGYTEKTDIWFTATGSAITGASVVYDLILIQGDNPTNPQ